MQRVENYIKLSKKRLTIVDYNSSGSLKLDRKQQKKVEMARKTILWLFQATNWWDYTQEEEDIVTKMEISREKMKPPKSSTKHDIRTFFLMKNP